MAIPFRCRTTSACGRIVRDISSPAPERRVLESLNILNMLPGKRARRLAALLVLLYKRQPSRFAHMGAKTQSLGAKAAYTSSETIDVPHGLKPHALAQASLA